MNLRENNSRSKEVLGAYWRQGLSELGAAITERGSVAQPTSYGMIGTRLPSDIHAGLHGKEAGVPDKGASLDAYVNQAKQDVAASREPDQERHLERE